MLPVGYLPCTQDPPTGANMGRVIDDIVAEGKHHFIRGVGVLQCDFAGNVGFVIFLEHVDSRARRHLGPVQMFDIAVEAFYEMKLVPAWLAVLVHAFVDQVDRDPGLRYASSRRRC